jgi:putative sterol carrier protein
MARLWSRELVEQVIIDLNSDPQHLQLAQLLSGKVVMRVLDDPDGQDIYASFTFKQGRCVDHSYQAEPAPSKELRERPFKPMVDGLVRITAQYATFVKLDKGEMEPADAITSPDYKIEGNMVMLMPYMQAVDSWNRKARKMPKEY